MRREQTSGTILIVEDEAMLRMHAVALFEGAGFRVLEALDAATALGHLAAEASIVLVFFDIQILGRIDGLELARRAHERRPDVRLILTSARIHLLNADLPPGAAFVAKPYRSEVVDRARRMIDGTAASGETKIKVGHGCAERLPDGRWQLLWKGVVQTAPNGDALRFIEKSDAVSCLAAIVHEGGPETPV